MYSGWLNRRTTAIAVSWLATKAARQPQSQLLNLSNAENVDREAYYAAARVYIREKYADWIDVKVEDGLGGDNFKKYEEIARTTSAKSISAEEMAKAAGLHDWYLTAYTLFSTSVHGSMNDIKQQFVFSEDGAEVIGVQSGAAFDGLEGMYLSGSETLLKALEVLELIFEIDTSEFRADAMTKLAKLMASRSDGASNSIM